jgi:F420-dependent oxidoreductase-like protein
MIRLAEGTLVVLIGPGASGKSSWAAEHFALEQVVSSDRLRALVGEGEADLAATADAFAVLELILAARIRRRLTCVIDTLGLDTDHRQAWRQLAARAGVPCVAVTFDTPAAECRRRNATRDKRIPIAVLNGQLTTFRLLLPTLAAEGFDKVIAAEPVRVVPPAIAAAARAQALVDRPPAEQKATQPGEQEATQPARRGPTQPDRPDQRLRFGLHLSSFEVPGGPAELGARLRDVSAAAEEAGFDALWAMDHLRQIPQLGRPWESMPEASVTLTTMAAATRRVSIGCLVHCITYRNVALLGRIVATLDVLSGGRAWCGLGAGWFEAEHAAYGWPFPPAAERLDLLEDALQVLPQLWGPGAPRFEGRRITVPEAMCYPRPLSGRVPILVGGGGERRTLRLVARYADACNLNGNLETVRHKIEVLHRHCDEVGRDPASVQVTHLSTALIGADTAGLAREVARRRPPRGAARWAARVTAGTVEDHILHASALQSAGVQQVIVSLEGVWDSDAVATFGDVIAALR